jgi:hypothetical protein
MTADVSLEGDMETRVRMLLVVLSAAAACEAPTTVGASKQAETATLFKPYAAYPVGSYAQGVAIGDLNGDGRNDVAVTTTYYFDPANDQMLHVFLQAPDGTLQPRVKYPLGQGPQSIDIGDVNGDGRADVVVGNFDSGSIGVLLQNGAGTLDPMIVYPTVNSLSVKIGDFNSDGRLDVVGINWGSRGDGVDVFLQTAAGTLAAPVTYHENHGGFDEVDVGDVNGDGHTDIVVMSGQLYAAPNVSVLLQNPDGTMAAPVAYSVGSNILTHGVAVGDVSGDGKQDVVVSYGGNRPSSSIARFLQNGAATLDPAASQASYDVPEPVVLADVDGDHLLDVLVAHGGWNELGVYRQRGGALAAEELYPIPYASHYQPQGLAAGDINDDGLPDVVLADYNNGLVVLLHVDDVAPGVAVSAPAPGSYLTGFPIGVGWTASDNVAVTSLEVSVSFDGGGSWAPVPGCTGLAPAATSCVWSSPGPAAADVRLRVVARDAAGNQGVGATSFALVAPAVTITAPSGGESWLVGTSHDISWTSNLPSSETVRVELTRDGQSYELLASSAPATGGVTWTATGPAATAAQVRITWNGGAASATSGAFALVAPSLTVTAPASGASWTIGTPQVIAWTDNLPAADAVAIELSRDGGATFQPLASAAPNSGSFPWTASGPATDAARVRITWQGGLASATSGIFALVAPTVTVTVPNTNVSWTVGSTRTISWTHNLDPGATFSLSISRDGGKTWAPITASAPGGAGSGSYAWVVTGPHTHSARIRVQWNGTPTALDQSNVNFTIK